MQNNKSNDNRGSHKAAQEDISQYYPDGDYQSMEDDDESYQAMLKKKQKLLRHPLLIPQRSSCSSA